MKICGIYKISNILNGKCYIGQSVDCKERINEHKRVLKNNKHPNKYLQNVYNLDNNSLNFEIFYLCPPQDLDSSEIYFIHNFNSLYKNNGYNLTTGGNSLGKGETHPMFGKKLSLEICKKLSEMAKKRIYTVETRKKMSNSRLGKRAWNKGLKNSITPWNKGLQVPYSKETLEKMSNSHKGKVSIMKGKTHTKEAREKISKAHKGKIAHNKGKVMSNEQKLKLISAWKIRKERKNAS